MSDFVMQLFKNFDSLTSQDPSGTRKRLLTALNYGIDSGQPGRLLERSLRMDKYTISCGSACYDLLDRFDRVMFVSFGKGSLGMALKFEEMACEAGIPYVGGMAVVPVGTGKGTKTRNMQIAEGDHPHPGWNSLKAAYRVIEFLGNADRRTLVIAGISGGASAMLEIPHDEISFGEYVAMNKLLLRSGANINQINSVRKHLSKLKGGQLIGYANGATFQSLIISDVIGDDIGSIGSGATAPDETTFKDAVNVIDEFSLRDKASKSIITRLDEGAKGMRVETPKESDPIFKNVHNMLIGNNEHVCLQMKAWVEDMYPQYEVRYLGSEWQSDVGIMSAQIAQIAASISKQLRKSSDKKEVVAIFGGEATVKIGEDVIGKETRGGRNQHAALMVNNKLKGLEGVYVTFCASDGRDYTNDAGGIADPIAYSKAKELKLDLDDYLMNYRSGDALEKMGALLTTDGPTGTNLMDIGIAVFRRA
ncbi:MAG: DUF4147 domain-containing protein [Candidatus Micrarchaeota archaeon]|nr:DUF4147 domain-containing protein [Candidatus Micrarchaeota archaeon]